MKTQTTTYVQSKYHVELESLLNRKVERACKDGHLLVRNLVMGGKEATRIIAIARANGYLICGQLSPDGDYAKPGERMDLYLHVTAARIKQDVDQRAKPELIGKYSWRA